MSKKATVINPGKLYSRYKGFADKHGYPAAASEYYGSDTRREPNVGDVVTLLTSGMHPRESEGTLWVIETVWGDQFIIGEEGLRMEVEKVTVLADESIGGVEREYREVKRAATVGERIKIVAAGSNFGKYENGSVLTVDRVDTDIVGCVESDAVATDEDGGNPDGFIEPEEYVVLEQTDIVWIDGADGASRRFRLADRSATKGDRIIFVSSDEGITAGRPYSVYDSDSDGGEFKDDNGDARWQYFGSKPKSFVIEPLLPVKSVDSAIPAAPDPTDFQRQLDEMKAAVAALSDRVAKLETQREDVVVSADIAEPSRDEIVTRDTVVRRAKEDVADLSNAKYGKYAETSWTGDVSVSFVIDRDKRTAVALLRLAHVRDDKVYGRGIAKAAPGDAFNEYIGKAIALRRALKLPVPAEYTDAPQPEGVRVGDVVTFPVDDSDGWYGVVTYRVNNLGRSDNLRILTTDDGLGIGSSANGGDLHEEIGKSLVMYDDSARYSDKPSVKPSSFSVGDRVRIIGNGGHFYDIGDIGEVVSGPNPAGNYIIKGVATSDAARSRHGYTQRISATDLEAA